MFATGPRLPGPRPAPATGAAIISWQGPQGRMALQAAETVFAVKEQIVYKLRIEAA